MNEDQIKQYGLRVAKVVRDAIHEYNGVDIYGVDLPAIVASVAVPQEKNTQQPVAWIEACDIDDLYAEGAATVLIRAGMPEYECIPLYLSPPVPRDVLMAALVELDGLFAAEFAPSLPVRVLERLADRYASKVQPEPTCHHRIADARNPVVTSGYLCVDCGALFSAADHGDIVNPISAQPEPVSQQLLAALKRLLECYKMADHHDGYCCCGSPMATHDDPMNCGHCATDAGEYSAGLVIKEMEADIAAAEAAQSVGQADRHDNDAGATWAEAQRICDLPPVDEAIRAFVDDNTGDNATAIVATVLEAVNAQQPASAKPVAVPDDVIASVERSLTDAWRLGQAMYQYASGNSGKAMTMAQETQNEFNQVKGRVRAMLSAAQKPEGDA